MLRYLFNRGSSNDAEAAAEGESEKPSLQATPQAVQDPKAIIEIMARIAKLMECRDLLRLRQTCKAWNEAMIPEIRRKHKPINISIDERPPSETFGPPECDCLKSLQDILPFVKATPKNLTQILMDSPAIPYSSLDFSLGPYALTILGASIGNAVSFYPESRLLKLLRCWGPCLTKLDLTIDAVILTNSQRTTTTGLRSIVFNPSLVALQSLSICYRPDPNDEPVDDVRWEPRNLPKLRRLKLSTVTAFRPIEIPFACYRRSNLEPDIHAYMTALAREVLQAAPDLEFLHVDGYDDFMLRTMIVQPNTCQKLRKLEAVRFSQAPVGLLTNLCVRDLNPVQLSELDLNLQLGGQISANLVTNFLASQSPFMIKLGLSLCYRPQEWKTIQFTFPVMDVLKKLKIANSSTAAQDDLTMLFAANGFPALESIQCEKSFNAVAGLAHFPVIELAINELNVELLNVRQLDIWYPSLVRLTLTLKENALPQIWSYWPHLEYLDIKLTDVSNTLCIDGFLTGISAEDCYSLQTRISKGEEIELSELRNLKHAYGITDLTCLREFCLSFLWETNLLPLLPIYWSKLTDVTGYFGFAAPGSKLQRISVKCGALCKISDTCQAAIKKELGPCSVLEFA